MTEITIIELMTLDEAQAAVTAINSKTAELVTLLFDLKQREGWRALGFTSWTDCLRSNLFHYSRKTLYEIMRAQPVAERIERETGIRLNHSQANALATYPDALQAPIVATVNQRYAGVLTESRIKRVGDLMTQMVSTGHVESAPGTVNAVEAALSLVDEEAAKRQSGYRFGNREYLIDNREFVLSPNGDLLIEGLPAEAQVVVSVWKFKDKEDGSDEGHNIPE